VLQKEKEEEEKEKAEDDCRDHRTDTEESIHTHTDITQTLN